jgi:hypothetical protein
MRATQLNQSYQNSSNSSIFSSNSRLTSLTKSRKQPQSSPNISTASAESTHYLPVVAPMPKLALMDTPPEIFQRTEGKSFSMSWQHGQSQWTSLYGHKYCITPCSFITQHLF